MFKLRIYEMKLRRRRGVEANKWIVCRDGEKKSMNEWMKYSLNFVKLKRFMKQNLKFVKN